MNAESSQSRFEKSELDIKKHTSQPRLSALGSHRTKLRDINGRVFTSSNQNLWSNTSQPPIISDRIDRVYQPHLIDASIAKKYKEYF